MKRLFYFLLFFQSYLFGQSTITDWKKILQNAKHDTTKLKSYAQLAFLYTYANVDSAAYYLKLGEPITALYPQSPITFSFYNSSGSYYATIREQEKAILNYEKAKALAYKINNPKLKKTASFNLIGCKYIDLDKYSLAIKALFEFKALLDSTNESNPMYYHAVYGNLSGCYSALNDSKNGEFYAMKILEYSKTKSDSLEHYRWLLEALSKDSTDFNRIQKIYFQSQKLARVTDNVSHELILLSMIGDVCIKTKRYSEALQYAKKKETLAKKNKFERDIMYGKVLFGQAYLGLNQYQKSIQYFKEAIDYCRGIGTKDFLLKSLKGISEAYFGLQNHKKAYQFQTEASILENELLGNEKQKIVAELDALYQLSDKEKQIVSKDFEMKLQAERTQTERRQKYNIAILLVLSLIFAAWNYWNYQKQNKLSLALAEEKQVVEKQALQMLKLNHTKDKLFAIIGHDLRSPVAGLQVILNDFANYQGGDIQQKINTLRGRVSGLYDTLNNLLKWASIQMNENEVSTSDLNLRSEIEETLELLSFNIDSKKITLVNQVQSGIKIRFNEQNLQAILRNVLSNAIKFTQENGYIKLATETNGTEVILSIKDTGVGIPENLQKKLFDNPKSRIGTKGEHGTGLGLKLCKDLIVASGGKIEITSEENNGTNVRLIFAS